MEGFRKTTNVTEQKYVTISSVTHYRMILSRYGIN